MDTKKEAKKYLNKYFKAQHINENDDEFKSLVRLLNNTQKTAKNCSIPPISNSLLLDKNNDIDTVGKCANCGVEFHIHKINDC